MQHRLAVQPDDLDLAPVDGEFGEKALDRRDMRVGDGGFELDERPRRARRVGDDRAQLGRDLGRVGIGRARAGLEARLAVGADQRDVDAVHRRAADGADRRRQVARAVAHCASLWLAPGTHSTSARPPSLATRAATNR